MLLPIHFKADWARLKHKRQQAINENNARENSKRIQHVYHPGDKVLKTIPGVTPKLHAPRKGPFVVEKVNANGTALIRKGAVTETVNIRMLSPYFER
jgi:hypothetical protein